MFFSLIFSICMYLINCCFSISIKLNRDIVIFEIPMKINKNTTNTYTYYGKYDK